MAFPANGVVEAPAIVSNDYGIFAVVKPEDSSNEDRWIRGFSQEWDTSLYSAKLWDDTDTTSQSLASDGTPTYYTEIKPFFIEVEDLRSTLGFMGIDRLARLKRQVEGITQKAVEKELWDGTIRKGESHENLALSDSTATVLNGGTALSAARAGVNVGNIFSNALTARHSWLEIGQEILARFAWHSPVKSKKF